MVCSYSPILSIADNITLEMDRFDPGRPNKERTAIAPTSLIAGDVVAKTQVTMYNMTGNPDIPHTHTHTYIIQYSIVALVCVQVVFGCLPDSKYLTHNLTTLGETLNEMGKSLSLHHTATLDPTSLLSLRIHCSCSEEGAATLRCGCVMPAQTYQATPIPSIPIVSTALARNLSGPLPLSALQGKTKHGYITMDISRKIVLLLHSDPIVSSLPLVGV